MSRPAGSFASEDFSAEETKRTSSIKAMNHNKKIFFINLSILILLISFDTVAKVTSFYYFYPNTDILMHFIGGLSITGVAISILRYLKMYNSINIFIIIFFLSILWEYVEFRIGRNIFINKSFWIDTAVDLLMNCIGGIIAYICFYKIQMNKNHQKNLLS